ncbi:MAG: zinc ribbon domain-containing protein [Deltaproteobacteria bacterium]|nr:zinc ribbon domain-containing protein [Deltaproteobacteria bacterium]MBW1919100.1 zinc ribbon domain-containing protein [Deltaproteobacteria bacterium]MBW1935899.1 zinc ribbon domain-containing protein [Deltaproteobacteria bacterium]MBW1977812.1 zinc ribbon domain-containing protein [Deltaproteobacteria bacterium]MBW2044394.1 zinc ribbon domain-containing protein [Deltaproteobacteria bacterium]
MPIYEYRCTKCNKEFEYLVLGSEKGIACPECDSRKVVRLMSACSFKSDGDFSSSSGSSACSTCSGGTCSTCH